MAKIFAFLKNEFGATAIQYGVSIRCCGNFCCDHRCRQYARQHFEYEILKHFILT